MTIAGDSTPYHSGILLWNKSVQIASLSVFLTANVPSVTRILMLPGDGTATENNTSLAAFTAAGTKHDLLIYLSKATLRG